MFTLLAVVVPGSAFGAAADPRTGSWTVVSAQSSINPPNTLTVTPIHDLIHVVMAGETHIDFTAKSNGHDTTVPGNPGFNEVTLRRIDKRQTEVTEKKDGAVVSTVRVQLSKDGKELTVTTVSTGHADQITVWARTGGPKTIGDPLAGEWTEDLSKTLMRQGLALKIEPDGAGGTRFTGEYSYTARFDGRPYDVRGSRNDNVALALADPHTVDAVYRRDNQISQRDHWVVSTDGQQMTLTSTATLENGQQLSEKLVFKKQ